MSAPDRFLHHDHNPLNADFTGGVCPACEQARDDERQLHHDFGREVAWELEQGRLDSPYLQGVMARIRADDGFTQNEEWPDV